MMHRVRQACHPYLRWVMAHIFMFLLFFSPAVGFSYPSHWWKPVSENQAADWEILPQAAGQGEVILSKRNELGILSNFAHTPFQFRGKNYLGVEGFWQMMKYPESQQDPRARFPGIVWPFSREAVSQMVGFEARQAGDRASANMKKMGINWVSFEGKRMPYRDRVKGEHYKLIRAVMWEKLKQNPKVREILLSTGDLKLLPDHRLEKDVPPAWRYHEIWMEVRAALQKKP